MVTQPLLFSIRARHPRPRPLLFLLLFFLLASPLAAQNENPVSGDAFDTDGYPLAGASIRWENGEGSTVDIDGNWTLPTIPGQDRFSISFIGYRTGEFWTDTLDFPVRILLPEASSELETIRVTARDDGRSASLIKTLNVETVSSKELRKAPCCSLAESFENSPVVDLTYGDPLTGRREIQVLGLSGRYAQLTLEKKPFFEGLGSPYALDIIPGPWVESIQIGKGAGSLESGAQGMTGQINTELIKAPHGPKLFVNAFAGSQGRGELNVSTNRKISKNLWLGVHAHGSFTEGEHDFDDDGFLDMPNRQTGVGLIRLFRRGGDNWEGQWNVLVSDDERAGGSVGGIPMISGSAPIDVDQRNRHVEAWGKTGYFGFAKPHQSVGFIYGASYHELDNRYWRTTHTGTQRSGYLNALYHTQIGSPANRLSLGLIGRFDNVAEFISATRHADGNLNRSERAVGASAEYTFSWEESRRGEPYRALTAIVGLRLDEHNLGGTQLSPRLNVRYNPNDQTALRLTAGRGWRSPNALVDNLNWLASNRRITFAMDDLAGKNPGFFGLESSWNFGLNLTREWQLRGRPVQFVLDLYRTEFQNQLILDADQDYRQLRIYQLDGKSFANGLLASLNYELFALIDVKLAYKYNDVRQTYAEAGLREVPLTPRHRALATVGYDGPRFRAHLNYHWVGRQRLADLDDARENFGIPHPDVADAFGQLSLQLTYVLREGLEIYAGGENLTDVRQRNAVIFGDNRSDSVFDASQVYQPVFGARAFVGVRWTVE